MIEIKRMDRFGRDIRDEVTDLFLDGFHAKLAPLTRNREKLKTAFRNEIRPDMFHVAELDGKVAGILAVSTNTSRALPANRTSLRRGLGVVRGIVAYTVLRKDFNSALPYDDDTGYIEWVATSEPLRGRGVSTALFRYVLDQLPYTTFVLEVLDVNDEAHRLYQKLGFDEYARTPASGGEKKFFTERIHMRRSRAAHDGSHSPDNSATSS